MRRYRVPLAAAGLGVLLVLGFWLAVYQPRAGRVAALEAETEQLKSQQGVVRSAIARLEAIAAEEDRVRADLATAQQLIPTDVQQPALLAQLQEAADAADVDLDGVTFGEPTPVQGAPEPDEPGTVLAEISVTLTLAGDYFELVDLLGRLERDVPRAMLVDNLHLTEAEEGFPALSGVASGRAFSLVPSDDLAEGAQPSTEQPSGAQSAPDDAAAGGGGA